MYLVQLLTLYLAYLFVFNLPFAQADVHIAEWDYDHHHTSSEHWKGTCHSGQNQSPINIDTNQTIKEKWGQPFLFHGYEETVSMEVTNNQHTIVVKFSNDYMERHKKDIWIRGGGLGESKFQFAQAHFHWGSTNDQGSEHTINNVSAPMEMHLVHWNLDVGNTVKEVVDKDDYNSFEVLTVHFKIGKKNEKFEPLFNAATKVATEHTNATMEDKIMLKDLLPKNTNEFYRYKGSLTTPPCNEIVVWTIFKQPIEVAQEQLDVMRKTYYHREGESEVRDISNNFRSPQNLHGREVLEVDTTVLHVDCANKRSPRSNGGISTKNIFLRNKYMEYGIFIFFLSIVCYF